MEPSSFSRLETLYCDHHGWLHGWLRRKLGNAHDAADLAQDTFIRLLASRRFHSLNDEPRALLTHIAKGLMVDHWRRQDVEAACLEALAALPAAHAPSPETRALVIEALLQIEAMLAGLPARSRQVFLMAQLDGMTLKQISAQTGLSVMTVRRHIHKALMACLTVAE